MPRTQALVSSRDQCNATFLRGKWLAIAFEQDKNVGPERAIEEFRPGKHDSVAVCGRRHHDRRLSVVVVFSGKPCAVEHRSELDATNRG